MPLSSLFVVTMLPFASPPMNGVGHLESEIKEDEGDAGLSGIDTDHTSMSWSLNNLIRIFTLEKEGLRKGVGGGEGKSPE